MKARLLKILRSRPDRIPADILTADLDCDVGRLETEIAELTAHGYVIAAADGGYRLVDSPDIPFAWEFPEQQGRIYYYPSTGSTMDVARQMARDGSPHGTVVIAGVQTRGRGRMERTWLSDAGGLYFTLVLKPSLPPAAGFKLNFLASLTLVEVLRRVAGIEVAVKWPNDILAGGRKLCGLLSEMEASAEAIGFVNIGIGVNVNNMPAAESPGAISIRQLTGRRVSRNKILSGFLEAFESGLSNIHLVDTIRRWKTVAGSLGKPVTVVTHQEEIRGVAEDVDDDGSLIVRLADGTRRSIIYGDCFHRS